MFGLMLKNSCATQEASRENYRLHYCGTCKAIGKQYSQSARMFLNFDCVFMAELLSALSSENTDTWADSYHSISCLATGGEGQPMPFPLKYAATSNVLLAALKTDDNLTDAPSLFWRTLKRWFDADFRKSADEMTRFGVDMTEIWQWISIQQQREKQKADFPHGEAALPYFAAPTAQITAAIFARGAALAGRPDENIRQFGYRLGELVYVLDALEDEAKDRRKKQFNALQAAYGAVDNDVKNSVAAYLFDLSRDLQQLLGQMALPQAIGEEFQKRLSANVAVRVANALESHDANMANLRRTLRERVAARVQKATTFARRLVQDKPSWIAAPQYAFSWMAVMLAPALPNELNQAVDQNAYTVPSLGAVFTGLLSAMIFRRPVRRFIKNARRKWRLVKEEWKRERKEGAKSSRTANIIFIILGICGVCCCISVVALSNIEFDICGSESGSGNGNMDTSSCNEG